MTYAHYIAAFALCLAFYLVGFKRGSKCGEAQGIWLARSTIGRAMLETPLRSPIPNSEFNKLVQEIRTILWRMGKTADRNAASLAIRLWNWYQSRKQRL